MFLKKGERKVRKDMAMIRRLVIIAICCLIVMGFSGPAESQAASAKYKSYVDKVRVVKKNGKKFDVMGLLPRRYKQKYNIPQGGTTDGKNIYQVLWKKNSNKCIIVKFNAKKLKRVALSKPLKIYHGNDLAFVKKHNKIYVSNCDGKRMHISVVHPKTLKLIGSIKVKVPKSLKRRPKNSKVKGISALDYNAELDKFVGRIRGNSSFLVLNDQLKPVEYSGTNKKFKYRGQGMFSDSKSVYILYDKQKKASYIMAYSWSGKFKYKITLKTKYEIENLFRIGKKHYAAIYYGRWTSHGFKRSTYLLKINMKYADK